MSTRHHYEAASSNDPSLPPPSPARFITRQTTAPLQSSQLTNSATLIDDHSRHAHEDDEYSLHKRPPSPETTPTHRHHTTGAHTPVAATVLFARNAPPLSLPKLDQYLSRLTPSSFTEVKSNEPAVMFPPMQELAKSGSTIENLEYNFKPAPWYRNRNTLLGSAVNLIIGTTVRSLTVRPTPFVTCTARDRVRSPHSTVFKA
jgi:hypothetical protein